MKKIIFGLLLTILSQTLLAQINNNVSKNISKINSNNSLVKLNSKQWIEIFPDENFKGEPVLYTAKGLTPQLNKKLSKVSFKLSAGTVAYLTINCTDIPSEVMITGNNSSYSIPDMGGICGIRLDERAAICIKFNGIETQIHNNDCKKVTGTLNVSVIEKQDDGSFVSCFNKAQKLKTVFMDAPKGSTPNFSSFVYNTLTEPPAETVRNYSLSPIGPIQDSFIVGKSAIRDKRIFIKVSGDINTEHKMADLATDYTDNVHRAFNDEFNINRLPFFNLQAKGKALIAGPYKAMGVQPRDPGYIIQKQLKIFLAVVYDFRISGE